MERKNKIPESVLEELRLLEVEDKILLLSIGKMPSSNIRIEKTAFLLSEIIGIKLDVVPYKYGMFSETIYEKLHDERLSMFFKRTNGKVELTKEGQWAYDYLLERLKSKNKEDAVQLLEALQRLSDEDLLAITYHLFPESKLESEIKERVQRRIEELKKSGFAHGRLKDDRVVIEIGS